MTDHKKLAEEFFKEITNHEMQVIHAEGVHRHIRFKSPGTLNLYFDLITWPGHLCITGDCGTYVFQRTEDMFNFFRGNELKINPAYWGEKLQSICQHGGYKRYSREAFRENVLEEYKQFVAAEELSDDAKAELLSSLEEEVLSQDEFEIEAIHAATGFNHPEFNMQDFWEVDCTEYTTHYLWNLWAIVWGIKKYDDASADKTSGVAA